jgi:hypothetical protein
VTAAIVDCMACLVTGVLTPVGFRDDHGILHRVRWHVHKGPHRLCDFVEDGSVHGRLREGARRIGIEARDVMIALEEP